jgi:polar amino acid transport system substrate-binding protein
MNSRIFAMALLSISVAGVVAAQAEDLHFVMHDYPPLSFAAGGKPTGAMTEIVEAICAEAGKTCDIKLLPWRRALSEVENGRAQGIFPLIPGLAERHGQFEEMPPAVQSSLSFVVPATTSWVYDGVESLRGKTVVVFGPSGTSLIAQNLTNQAADAKIDLAVENEVVLRKLAGGRYPENSVALCNHDVAVNALAKEGVTGIKLAGNAATIFYTIGLSRDGVSAKDKEDLDNALTRLKLSGTLQKIAAAYGVQAPLDVVSAR